MKPHLVISYFCLCLPLCASATFQSSPVIWTSGDTGHYSPFDPVPYFQEQTLVIRSDGDQNTRYFITFSPGGVLSSQRPTIVSGEIVNPSLQTQKVGFNRKAHNGQNALEYQLYQHHDSVDSLQDLSLPLTDRNVVSGTIILNRPEPTLMPFYISVPPNQNVRPGIYKDRVSVRLYYGTPQSPQQAQLIYDEPMDIQISVANVAVVGWANGVNELSWTVDELAFKKPGSVQLIIQSNTSVKTSVESESTFNYQLTQSRAGNNILMRMVPERNIESDDQENSVIDTVIMVIEELL